MSAITFIVPVSDHDQYQRYFLSSPLFERESHFEIHAQAGFRTSGQAYNDGIQKAQNDLIVCAHQDVVLPAMWATRFLARRSEVESIGVPVGVVGCWGRTPKGDYVGHIYHRDRDRKSTRLNSSHGYISYAVFCLKKKNSFQTGVCHATKIACM